MVFRCVTVPAQQPQVVEAQRDRWIPDVVRSNVDYVVHGVTRDVQPTSKAALTQPALVLNERRPAFQPGSRGIKGACIILSHSVCRPHQRQVFPPWPPMENSGQAQSPERDKEERKKNEPQKEEQAGVDPVCSHFLMIVL